MVKKWILEEDELLSNNKDMNYLLSVLDRTESAILQRAVKLGFGWDHFFKYGTNKKWGDKEVRLLIKLYDGSSERINELVKLLSRSRKAIIGKANYMGLSSKRVNFSSLFKR